MNPQVTTLLTGKARQLGRPGAADPMERPWTTGIFKAPVEGDLWLSASGLTGDEVGDTINHGGSEKALFVYPAAHYHYWKRQPGLESITVGGMGENLSIINASETTVCIGDIYQFHDTVVQVSQPRQPCWRPARRFRVKDLSLQIQETGRTGWYFRVLREGLVRSGVELTLIERTAPQWTVARCNEVMHHNTDDLELAAALASLPQLSPNWKATLEKRLAGKTSSIEKRLYGPNADANL